jgi:hypothetical protein
MVSNSPNRERPKVCPKPDYSVLWSDVMPKCKYGLGWQFWWLPAVTRNLAQVGRKSGHDSGGPMNGISYVHSLVKKNVPNCHINLQTNWILLKLRNALMVSLIPLLPLCPGSSLIFEILNMQHSSKLTGIHNIMCSHSTLSTGRKQLSFQMLNYNSCRNRSKLQILIWCKNNYWKTLPTHKRLTETNSVLNTWQTHGLRFLDTVLQSYRISRSVDIDIRDFQTLSCVRCVNN